MRKGQSPTSRTLAECRRLGWLAEVVERRKGRFIAVDFLGCVDILALTDDGIVALQVTSAPNHASRVAKAKAEPRLHRWLRLQGATFEVWSWGKRGARGKRKTWQLRREPVTLVDLVPLEISA